MPSALTVDELVEQHKVILHRFLVEAAKVGPPNADQAIAELKYESRICIASARGEDERSGPRSLYVDPHFEPADFVTATT